MIVRVGAALAALIAFFVLLHGATTSRVSADTDPCGHAQAVPAALRLPAVVPPGEPVAIEMRVLAYLQSYRYRDLGWCEDKAVRDTGPYIAHVSYGSHPAVRIYYSPEVMTWLRNGRRGVPRDGAVIIKEQYGAKPAAAYAGLNDRELRPTDWTIMIRRSSASPDGWFWAEVYTGMFAAAPSPVNYPNAGFGLYCLRCHASAARALTFSSLENIRGFPGEPLIYRVDDSWRSPAVHVAIVQPPLAAWPQPPVPHPVQTFPAESLDAFVGHGGLAPFVTSSQCMSCHSASRGAPFGPVMWVTPAPSSAAPGINVSEYGEWRWSPMALAGRDPVFYAQLESELAFLQTLPDRHTRNVLQAQTVNTCTSCHAVMGQRTFAQDHPGQTFSARFVFDADPAHPTFADGGLARDGISCTVCHRAVPSATPHGTNPLAYFLAHKINGQFDLGPPKKLFGPFTNDTITTHAMNEALDVKPVFSSYVRSSQLCASCHTINLPVVDAPPVRPIPQMHSVEQATYLEWLNSRYQTDYHAGPDAKSCQDCHMPAGVTDESRGIALSHIASRIALVQDDTYPQTTNAAPAHDLAVRFRTEGYRRHELLGLNAFLLALTREFPGVLGVRTTDYMSGATTDLDDAIANVVRQARHDTARVAVNAHVDGPQLVADVEVVNLTGHRFPSGVGFRRAFLELEVRDATAPADAPPIFASGRTDARGRIIGSDGAPLASESFARGADGRQQYQEHFDEAHPITRSDQVQIFEELVRDESGAFTTSFIRRDHEVKDNRLLPIGWSAAGPTRDLPRYFLEATYPKGRAAADPRYRDGRGHAVVRYIVTLPPGIDPANLRVTARLYYQSWAPYFLAQRKAVPGVASRRLGQLVDALELGGTPLDDWKIRVAEGTVTRVARGHGG